jgi:sugar lactone lactonase YvrE
MEAFSLWGEEEQTTTAQRYSSDCGRFARGWLATIFIALRRLTFKSLGPPVRSLFFFISKRRYFMKSIVAKILCATVFPLLALSVGAQTVTTIASGLNGPRGLNFGPDGALYVAEAGTGGPNGLFSCEQVPAPVGPYHGGPTATVSRIGRNGERTTVVSGLPSAISSLPSGDTDGASDVVFLGDNLYVLLAGGGCSHGNPEAPAGIVRARGRHGAWDYTADLSAYLKANPVANPNPGDFEPDGTFFSMVVHKGHFYAVEPNHGEIVRINPGGHAERFIDISASQGHVVPTAIAFHDGFFYVGTLDLFPITPGSAKIYKISESGEIVAIIHGLTTVTGLTFDSRGRLYALELSGAAGFPSPGAGKLVRVDGSNQIEDIVTGLVVPAGLTTGPDDALYISNFGAAPPGLGQILRVDHLDDCDHTHSHR